MAIGSAAHALEVDGFTDQREQTQYQIGDVELIVARHSGYCWGVQRAYDMTLAEAGVPGQQVATHGPLIHNPQTVAQLERDHGVRDVSTQEPDADDGVNTVIIRSHGAPLETQAAYKEAGKKVVNATCPYVQVSQRYAALLNKERYHVVIIGNPNHPEIVSIKSYAKGDCTCVTTPEEVKNIPKGKRRLGVVIQSTMILKKAEAIIAELIGLAAEVRVFNTICYVTDERQIDAEEVAKATEFVVVIGGRASSNTKKLAVVAENFGARTQLIEGPENLNFDAFGDVKKIGILAGASTPNWLIDQVIEKIEAYYTS